MRKRGQRRKSNSFRAWPGNLARVATAKAFIPHRVVYSSLQRPNEVYLADSAETVKGRAPITTFNKSFTARELPQGKPTDGSRATAHPWKAC